VNLLVRNVARSANFSREVFAVAVHYPDDGFAARQAQELDLMLHANHTYDDHPLEGHIHGAGHRGTGAKLWVLGVDPDKGEAGARQAGSEIPQPSKDVTHGWRDVIVVDQEGYICAVGMPLKSRS
jgi:hypothetical protein